MAARISISARDASVLVSAVYAYCIPPDGTLGGEIGRVYAALKDAIAANARKSARQSPRRRARDAKGLSEKERMAALRAEVFARAEGRCEYLFIVGATAVRCDLPADDLEHVFGKRTEHDKFSPECCLAVCRQDHRKKTDSEPSAEVWQDICRDTLFALGFKDSARRCSNRSYFASVKASLPAAPGNGGGLP